MKKIIIALFVILTLSLGMLTAFAVDETTSEDVVVSSETTEDVATSDETIVVSNETTEDEAVITSEDTSNEAPATGDSTIAIFALLAVLSGATLFTIKKKNA